MNVREFAVVCLCIETLKSAGRNSWKYACARIDRILQGLWEAEGRNRESGSGQIMYRREPRVSVTQIQNRLRVYEFN